MSTLSDAFSNIANSIRGKLGTQDTFTPLQMADAINNIPSGGGGGEELANSYTAVVNNEYRMSASCTYMFAYNTVFNQPVTIGDNVTRCDYMFYNCINFNQPVTIPNNVNNCGYMFYGCGNFNQPVTIPNNVNNCIRMFYNCINFNQPVTIPNNVNNCTYMFSGCGKFNQPVTIPNNVNNCGYMFYGCGNFNQPVTIPNNVDGCPYMFYNCQIFNQNIYIKSIKVTNVKNMLYNHSKSKQINLFCTNLASLNKTTASTSLTGTAITWTDMPNGYYNTSYNIYLYNNLPSGI